MIPTVILLGDSGVGKSRVIELLMDCTEGFISSDALFSATLKPHVYPAEDFDIIDTPGANGLQNRQHILWLATAFNHCPLSLIGIVVKAETRVDNVIEALRKYYARWQYFESILCPIITHMDLVTWTSEDMLQALEEEFGKKFRKAVFSRKDPNFTRHMLSQQILRQCAERPVRVDIHDENFSEYFKVENNNIKVLQFIREERDRYSLFVDTVRRYTIHPPKNQVHLLFEAMNFLLDQIEVSEQRLIAYCQFDFNGPDAAVQYGHCAALRLQISELLFEMQTVATRWHSVADCDVRSCPYCGAVWNLVEGCSGQTTCGETDSSHGEVHAESSSYATFSFPLDPDNRLYRILEKAKEEIPEPTARARKFGCGRAIKWATMAPYPVSPEWKAILKPPGQDVPSLRLPILKWFIVGYQTCWEKTANFTTWVHNLWSRLCRCCS